MKLSLKFKLILFINLIVIVEAALLVGIILPFMGNNEINSTIQQVQTIVEISSDNLAGFLKEKDKEAVTNRLIALKSSSIVFVQVYSGNILFDSVQEDMTVVQQLFSYIKPDTNRLVWVQTAGMLVYSSPIYYNGNKIGALILGYSLKSFNTQMIGNTVIAIIVGLFILAAAIFISMVFVNTIVKAISILSEYARKMSEGDLTLSAIQGQSRDEIGSLFASFNAMQENLKEVITRVSEIIVNLNSSSHEIDAAAQEQTTAANEHASGITEVSATLEELSITAKQITKNAGELVVASEEAVKLLKSGEGELHRTLTQIEEVGQISQSNTMKIGELGKSSKLIGEMVEIIKDVSNKTNMLSINASIEASRAGEAGRGFSVVAGEIRELSRETLTSAKKVGEAGAQIQNYLREIVVTSESESNKVMDSLKVVKTIAASLEEIIDKISNNTEFTQKIDVSIKQQERGSSQASETMKQMAEIARQSAEISRQTLQAVKDIVTFSNDLDASIRRFRLHTSAETEAV